MRRGAPRTIDDPAGQAAVATFFFHFPVMMLLVGATACVTRTVALATAVARSRRPGAIV